MPRSPYDDIRQAQPQTESQDRPRDVEKDAGGRENAQSKDPDFSPDIRYREIEDYPQERTLYRFNERQQYCLRRSELYTMAEAGKFRAVTIENVSRYLYSGNADLMYRDLYNLSKQGLVQVSSSRYPNHIRAVTLTKQGAKFTRHVLGNAKNQEIYSGLKKVREFRHDSRLYEVYQAKAREIGEAGGRIKRVVLDYELKKVLNRELKKAQNLDPDDQQRVKETIAQKHLVPVVQGSFVVPDVRIEYEDQDGNETRVDLEYLTETYRHGDISSKAQAGFHLYASRDQASRLHRVVDQHHIMTAILSL